MNTNTVDSYSIGCPNKVELYGEQYPVGFEKLALHIFLKCSTYARLAKHTPEISVIIHILYACDI